MYRSNDNSPYSTHPLPHQHPNSAPCPQVYGGKLFGETASKYASSLKYLKYLKQPLRMLSKSRNPAHMRVYSKNYSVGRALLA